MDMLAGMGLSEWSLLPQLLGASSRDEPLAGCHPREQGCDADGWQQLTVQGDRRECEWLTVNGTGHCHHKGVTGTGWGWNFKMQKAMYHCHWKLPGQNLFTAKYFLTWSKKNDNLVSAPVRIFYTVSWWGAASICFMVSFSIPCVSKTYYDLRRVYS